MNVSTNNARQLLNLRHATSPFEDIIEMKLGEEYGEVYLNSGFFAEVVPMLSHLLHRYNFGKNLKLESGDGATTTQWFSPRDREFYERCLVEVESLNIHGKWQQELLRSLVHCCLNLKKLSFTYWSCNDIYHILRDLPTKCLTDLTIQVDGTSNGTDEIMEALQEIGRISPNKMERLMIFLNQEYNGEDPVRVYSQYLEQFMAVKSTVVLLYNGEEARQCIWKLRHDHRFIEGGWMSVAVNDEALTPAKQAKLYTSYQLFKQENVSAIRRGLDQSISWIVGSQIGRANNHRLSLHYLPGGFGGNMDAINIPPYDPTTETHEMLPHFTDEELGDLRQRRPYSRINSLYHESTPCCTFQVQPTISPFNRYGIPSFGRQITRVREVIYHTEDTEFYLENGLYFRPDQQPMEEVILMKGVYADARIIIRCLDMKRHYIQSVGYSEFLHLSTHVELRGYWWSGTVQLLFTKLPAGLPSKLHALTMMNACTERTPFNHFNDSIQPEVRGGIKVLHYDCRDTREESMASIINGLWKRGIPSKSFSGLEQVFLCAPALSSPSGSKNTYITNLNRMVRNLVRITSPNAIIVLVIGEGLNEAHILEEDAKRRKSGEIFSTSGLNQQTDHCRAILPVIFNQRIQTFQSTLVYQHYRSWENREWYIYIPPMQRRHTCT
uniref:Uncharacterized protein n=1 Tax=Panagrolaimus superbus TaxID=310955 RepID=A0A914Y7L7_9BILA